MGTRNRVNNGIKRLSEKTPDWVTSINPDDVRKPSDVLVLVYGSESEGIRVLQLTKAHLVKKYGFATYENQSPAHSNEKDSLVESWKDRIAALKAESA